MFKHILVPVAFDPEHAPDRALDAAAALADRGARVSVVHVKEVIPSYAVSYVPQEDIARLRAGIGEELATLAGRFASGQGVLLDGHPANTIIEWAHGNAVDCIVIDSHRPGMADYLLGSTAARVVRHAQCSVMVLR